MGAAEPRYAEALFTAAKAADLSVISRLLTDFNACMAETPEVKRFLLNPGIPPDIRKETACKLLPDDTPDIVTQFISLLIDRRRLDKLPAICTAYHRLVNRAQDVLDIRVSSAQPLTEAQLEHIRARFVTKYGAQAAEITQETDPSLLGGVRVQIGDKVTDISLRTRLDDLRTILLRDVAKWA